MEKSKNIWKKVRKNNFDGLQKWNNLKDILKKYDVPIEWNNDVINLYDEMMK
jgi:hypothetical protein